MRMHLNKGDIAERMVLEWSLRQKALRESGTPAPPRPAVITISRQLGSDGGQISEALRQELGSDWQVWDRNLLEEIARRADVRLQMLEAVDEREQSQIDLTVRSLLSLPVLEEATYLHHLVRVTLTVAHHGHAIVVGRAGHLIVKEALKVRLRAPFAFRAANIAQVEGIPRPEAERRVRESDRQRAEFIRQEFERDIDDPDAYDLTLRTDGLGVGAAAAAIAAAARVRFGSA